MRAGLRAARRLPARQHREPVGAHTAERLRRRRDYLRAELKRIPGVKAAVPSGAMYAFLGIEGMSDSLAFCKRVLREQGLGLAPGAAFGPEGEGYVRWCFASSEERLADGVRRLAAS